MTGEQRTNKLSSLIFSCFLVAIYECFHCFGFEQPGDIGCSELNSDGFSHAWKSSFRVSSFLLIKLVQEKSEREDRYQAASTNKSTFIYIFCGTMNGYLFVLFAFVYRL